MASAGPNNEENLSKEEIHELEEILHTKIYPGTEIMKDVGTHHFVKSTNRRVLVPQPSDSPSDPLNWSPLWKYAALWSATLLSAALNFGPLALAPMFEDYIREWDASLADVVQFTGVAILVLGFSNFIWVPVMVCFGRRPVAILSSLICMASSIWRARATSYGSFMGASVLNGLGAGPCETLMPQVIADVVFLHERGFWQTLYFSSYFISLMVGPIVAGPMAERVGWRNFWWLNTALLAVSVLVNVFLFPETRYRRDGVVGTNKAPGEQRQEPLKSSASDKDSGSNNEATTTEGVVGEKIENANAVLADDELTHQTTHEDPALGHGKPSKAQWAPFQRYEGSIIRELWVPLYLHVFPIPEFAAFVVSWSASGFLQANLTQAQVFAAPPYGYSSSTIGLFNLALVVGGLIGLFSCGWLSDWVAAWLTARNNGVREPEMRLVTMVPYVIAMVVGTVVTAVGYDRHWAWQVIVVIGYGCLGMQVAALPSIVSTYAIDSYKPVTGSLFVMITINKNLWGYGMGKFITPWTIESGFVPPFITNMGLTLLWCLFGIVFWFYGKKFRGMTANSFVHRI